MSKRSRGVRTGTAMKRRRRRHEERARRGAARARRARVKERVRGVNLRKLLAQLPRSPDGERVQPGAVRIEVRPMLPPGSAYYSRGRLLVRALDDEVTTIFSMPEGEPFPWEANDIENDLFRFRFKPEPPDVHVFDEVIPFPKLQGWWFNMLPAPRFWGFQLPDGPMGPPRYDRQAFVSVLAARAQYLADLEIVGFAREPPRCRCTRSDTGARGRCDDKANGPDGLCDTCRREGHMAEPLAPGADVCDGSGWIERPEYKKSCPGCASCSHAKARR